MEHAACPAQADFDPLSPTFLADPFAVLATLPHEMPVFYAPAIDYYVVTRYADIEAILLDHESYSSAITMAPFAPLVSEAARILRAGGITEHPVLVTLDPPEHARLRSHTVRAFTPRRVAAMEPEIRAITEQLLDAVDPSAPFDLVVKLARPLPSTVIFGFLGIPERDWPQLKEWCGHRVSLTFGRPSPAEQVHHADNMAAYRGYLRTFVAQKAQERDDRFTSALLAIHDEDPGTLSLEEISSLLFALTIAGHETTTCLIGNLVRQLLEEPARWDAIVSDPTLIPAAVDETLRYDSPQSMWRRITRHSVKLGGVDLPAGAKLLLWIAASGRDGSVFPEPETFDLHRADAGRSLSFGKGIHYCLGPALAKLEAQLALQGLTNRFPRLRLLEGKTLSFQPTITLRGPEELWVQTAQETVRSRSAELYGFSR